MAFAPKDWRDFPETSTPTSAAAFEDLETRLADYTDDELAAAWVVLNATLASKQDVVTGATDAELAAHAADTTGIHGITDTANLATASDIATHTADTTAVHGITDTTALVTTSDARLSDVRTPTDGSVTAAKVNTALKPSGAATGTDKSLRRLGTGTTHAAAGDDTRFPSAGEKNALAGTTGTPGSGNKYVTDTDSRLTVAVPQSLLDAKGDIITATANDTPVRKAAGANGTALVSDSAQSDGLAWAIARPGYARRSGAWYPMGILGADPGPGALTQSRQYWWIIMVDVDQTFDRVGVNVNAGVATAVMRMGVYANTSGAPGALIADWGTIDASTTGEKPITISWAATRGVYWLSAVGQVANPNISRWNPTQPAGSTGPSTRGGTAYLDSVTGAMPNPAGAVSYVTTSVPAVMLRAA